MRYTSNVVCETNTYQYWLVGFGHFLTKRVLRRDRRREGEQARVNSAVSTGAVQETFARDRHGVCEGKEERGHDGGAPLVDRSIIRSEHHRKR